MLKKLVCVLALSAAASLSAAVLDFQNFERDGKPVLIPEVQKYEAADGVCKLPSKLTVSVPAGEKLILEQLDGELKRFGVSAVAGDDAAVCRFVLSESNVPEHKEGYTLTVDASGIAVAARTADGLFRGAQTLRNLIANAAAPELKQCRIVDWPDFDLRGYTFNLRSMPSKNLPLVKRTLEAMARLKLNTAFITLEECFPYRDNPFTKRKNVYTAEQVRDLAGFCAARHIRIVPVLQVWSHAHWMTGHPDWAKMKEGEPSKPWNSMPCPYNEEARELVRMAMEEHIAMFHPEVFHIAYDEIFLCPFRVCPRCKATAPHKILADYLEFVRGILDKHGIKMMVCQDSFRNNPRWPYGDWYRTLLRPDTYISWWSYSDHLDEKSMRDFSRFRAMGNALCGKPLNVYNMAHLVKKCGGRYCKMTYWYYSSGGLLTKLSLETPDSLGGFTNGADYLWKLRDTPYPLLGYDGTLAMMRIIHPEMLTLPPRGGVAAPVPLENAVNAELSGSGKFPRFDSDAAVDELKNALAKLPERFHLVTSPGGKYYALRVAGRKEDGRQAVRIGFGGRKAEMLSFLFTTSRSSRARSYHCASYGEKRFKYDPVAQLRIVYTDGSRAAVNLRYRKDITDWNRPFGGFNMRFAVRGLDADKCYYSFGIFDFKNPHPEKAIRAIELGTRNVEDISVALLAVSAWGADRPFAAPPAKFDPAVLKERGGVRNDDRPAPLRIVRDFEDGLGDLAFLGDLSKSMKHEIVDDPTSPGKGKVLKITVFPPQTTGNDDGTALKELALYMPYRVPAGTVGPFLDYKIVTAAPGDFSHFDDLFLGEGALDDPQRLYRRGTSRGAPPYWFRNIRPAPIKSARPLSDITQTRYRRLCFYFYRVSSPVEIYIGNIGDTAEDISSVPLWKLGTEAEPI